jgi:amino acid transporter
MSSEYSRIDESSPQHASDGLGLWDAVSLIGGIVVAASIFEAPSTVFASLNCPGAAMGMWALGGVLSLIGAFCYAELATAYPRSGGDYVYLTRAYGRFVGFLFGWSHLAGILTGSIGALAFVFADHAVKLFSREESAAFGLALLAVIALSLLNVFGLVLGKFAQNLLTILKTAGLLGVIVVGIGWGLTLGVAWTPAETPADFTPGWGFALILILFAFGGW